MPHPHGRHGAAGAQRGVLCAACVALAAAPAPALSAQDPALPAQTEPASGQSDRFSSAFNPAFSFVLDGVLDQLARDGDGEDGVRLELRSLEFGAQAWVDPNAWAYFVAVADEETVAVEEAAIQATGLPGRNTLRAGRFFIDFGKQMQSHVHELRTLDRPLVLATYLGDEVAGDGLQWDAWTSVGESTVLRWSLGAFTNLLPEQEEDEAGPTFDVADRKDPGDLNFTARATATRDVSDASTLQLGVSGRWIPEASAELNGGTIDGIASTVLGVDATWSWTSDDAVATWTAGLELLVNLGDTVALVDDGGTSGDPSDDALTGFDDPSQLGGYAFVEHAWDLEHSAGAQVSALELPEPGSPEATEVDLHYTRHFSEFHRLRFAVVARESDGADGDALRFALQYTATLGAHGHGIAW